MYTCISTLHVNSYFILGTTLHQLPSRKRIFDSELDSDDEDPIIGQQLELSSTNHGNETESVDVPLSVSSESSDIGPSKNKVMKTDGDLVPLPDPFPLPKRYRQEVEKGLKAKEMSNRVRSHFLSSVASAVLSYKLYPSREDYNCVARTIVKEYPFLKAPPGAGSPHVRSIHVQLVIF